MNNKGGLLTKKIPTLLGVFILLGGLVAGVILTNNRQGLLTKAGPTEAPKNVRISNISSSSLTISWKTDNSVTGFVKYSENPAKITTPAGDARDQVSGSSQGYTTHYVNLAGLVPEKTYYFVIGSGSQTYDDGGKPFQVRTTGTATKAEEDIVNGKIVGPDGAGSNGAIVYVEAQGGGLLSALSKTDGTWRANLGLSRDSSGKTLSYDRSSVLVTIFVEAGVSGTATAITNGSKARPVPDIVLGKNQNFVEVAGVENASESGAIEKSAGFASITKEATEIAKSASGSGEVVIVNPAINGEIIATSSPEFRGKAPSGMTIKVTVNSTNVFSSSVKADSDGNWKYVPNGKLETGAHTITVEYTDKNNVIQKITRSFTVLANSSLPSFVATPSARVTGSATPSATITIAMPATASASLTSAGGATEAMISIVGGLILLGSGLWLRKRMALR